MKIGIFGMGAVGCALYNELNGYNELYVLADDNRINKYKSGFMINDKLIIPNCSNNIKPDLLIIAVKNYHLNDSLIDIEKYVSPNTIILPLLNGIMAHDILQSYFKNNKVLFGVINVEANKVGNIIHTSKIINLQFGEEYNDDIKPYLKEISSIFTKYNVTHNIYPDMKRRVWLKWMLNMGINQISALLNATYKQMTHPYILDIMFNIFDEVYAVAKAYNINLDDSDLEYTKNMCKAFTSNRVTSLTIDFYNNQYNELDSFSKTLIDLASKKNISVPTNELIYKLLKALDDNKNQKD